MGGGYAALHVSGISEADANIDAITHGYSPIAVRSLFPDKALPCDIYSLTRKGGKGEVRLGRLIEKGRIYEVVFHQYLMDHEVDELYIKCDDEDSFTEYFNGNTQETIESGSASPEKKAELLFDQAEYVVRRVFKERPNRANIVSGQQLVKQISTHAMEDPVTLKAMFSLFSKDYYTFTHCIQVAVLGMSFCRFLGWKTNDVENFGMGALFHDIGKSAIDERILNKPGKLDREEFEIIKSHPLLGYEQIRATQVMNQHQLSVVLHHHEALDGSGYPHRLKGLHIPKYARIARIIDIYDALTTKRAYKDALSSMDAMQLMTKEMVLTLDLRLFGEFIKFLHAEKKQQP